MAMEPANSLVEFLGGPKVVAALLGRDLSRVYRWTYPEAKGGTGGLIPAREQRKLLEYCRENKIDLRADDFFSADRIQKVLAEQVARKEAAE